MPSPGRAERAVAFASWALPFGLALARASSHAQWRGDIGAVRDISLSALGWGGGASTVMTQLALLVPIGSLTFRATLVSLLACALAARALYGVSLAMLRLAERALVMPPSVLAAPLLAMLATFTATMTASFQGEATVGGSTMLAVALSLSVANQLLAAVGGEPSERPLAGLIGFGFLLGALTAENAPVGVATLVAGGVHLAMRRVGPSDGASLLVPTRVARWAMAAWCSGLLVFSLPGLLRAIAPGAAVNLGGPYLWGPSLPADVGRQAGLLEAWTDEVGWVALGMSALGALTLLLPRTGKSLALPALVFVTGDLAMRAGLGATEGTLALRLLAMGWMASMSTVGLYAFFLKLQGLRIPLARVGAALLMAFDATLVALTVEQASERANRSAQQGAEEFTNLALERLPPSAALVVDAPTTTWRMLAATLVEGRRPDVVLVPRRLLDKGDIAAQLLSREPQVEPLLRAIALGGTTDEFSLAELADVRPLFVELERGWSEPEYAHLSLSGVWLRFEAEPLTPLDRKVDVMRTLAQLDRVLMAVEASSGDRATAHVMRNVTASHAKMLLRTGDVKNASLYLGAMDAPGSPMAVSGSLQVAFASAVSRLPAIQSERERQKERSRAKNAAAAEQQRKR